MSLAAMRTDLVALLEPLVVDGGEVAPYAPDAVNAVPSIWLGDARANVSTVVSFRTWTYRIPVTCAVKRQAVYGEERAAATALLDDVVAALATDYSLGGTTYGLEIEEFVEGVVGPIGGEELVGFTIFLRVKEKPTFVG